VLFIVVTVTSIVVLSIGSYGVFSRGAVFAKNSAKDTVLDDNYGLARNCTPGDTNPACQTTDQPEIVVWGDSFAMHIVDGIMKANPKAALIQLTLSACSPIPMVIGDLSINPELEQRSHDCAQFNEQVLSTLDQLKSLKYAIISSRFSNHFTRFHYRSLADTPTDRASGEQALLVKVVKNF
jgi:hypothetical protein